MTALRTTGLTLSRHEPWHQLPSPHQDCPQGPRRWRPPHLHPLSLPSLTPPQPCCLPSSRCSCCWQCWVSSIFTAPSTSFKSVSRHHLLWALNWAPTSSFNHDCPLCICSFLPKHLVNIINIHSAYFPPWARLHKCREFIHQCTPLVWKQGLAHTWPSTLIRMGMRPWTWIFHLYYSIY